MRSRHKIWRSILVVLILLISCITPASIVEAGDDPGMDEALARKYAPILYFHPDELFRPQSVDVLVNSARLRAERSLWFDVNILPVVSLSDLLNYRENTFFLDAWYGSEAISEYKNYSFHRTIYQKRLSPDAGGPPVQVYAHVKRDLRAGFTTIQYWLFYYYNDWFNKHEGDWEMVEVILDGELQPAWVVLSQHHGGTRRPWNRVQVEDGTHPAVFVALGSHANYFWGNEVYPSGMNVGNHRVEVMDRTGISGGIIPEIELIPDQDQFQSMPDQWSGREWILFGGHWGESSQQGDFSGPFGPAFKGEMWVQPYEWGLSQPLDSETWYANRLRIGLKGASSQIYLESSQDNNVEPAEIWADFILLHRDLLPGEILTAVIEPSDRLPESITIRLPDPAQSQVSIFHFELLPSSEHGTLTITIPAGGLPELTVTGISVPIAPSSDATESSTWDAPDIIWIGGLFPVSSILLGFLLCLLMGWVPTLIYIRILYWIDRWEKEPLRLLAIAFIWGAIPALITVLILRVFVYLPPRLLGSNIVAGNWVGWFDALVEEILKGIIVLWIAVRYRREFDNVLDGIIYGGMVGLGFAMNANIIGYLGSFLTMGFDGLSPRIFMEGVLFGINHAFFTAIFGAGLGYARLSPHRWQRQIVPLGSFLLTVTTRIAYDRINQQVVGLSLGTVVYSMVGILALMVLVAWSLRQQHQCLAGELKDELPTDIYQTVLRPGTRVRTLWRILAREGVQSWRKHRRLYRLSAEYAFKKQQSRLFPGENAIADEAQDLRTELRNLAGLE